MKNRIIRFFAKAPAAAITLTSLLTGLVQSGPAAAQERAGLPVDLARHPEAADPVKSTITVDPAKQYQEIWGFGAAACGPAKSLEEFSQKARDQVLDILFSTNGNNAGLSVIRLLVNPSISPAKGVWKWNEDEAQVWLAREAANRAPMQIFGVPWSPPAWMKSNHSLVKGTLKTDHYGVFVDYLYDWAEKYRNDYGMKVRWVSKRRR